MCGESRRRNAMRPCFSFKEGGVIVSSDSGYIVTGNTQSYGELTNEDMWVLKLDSAGDVEWQKVYSFGAGGIWPCGNDRPFSILQTPDGGFIIVGRADTGGDCSPANAVLVKLNSRGVVSWARAYVGPGEETVYTIVPVQEGGFAMAGQIG